MKASTVVKGTFAVAVVMLAVGTGSAWAAVEIHGPHTEGPYSGFSTGSYTLPQFDTLGGTRTLLGVTVEVIIDSFGGKKEFDNQSPTAGSGILSIGSTVRVKGPIPGVGTQIILIPDAVTTGGFTITATTGDVPADFAGPDYASLDGTSVSDLKSASRSLAGDLVPYIGLSDVTFDWDLAGNSSTGQDLSAFGGGSIRTTSTTYNFHTTVYYEYIPEPASLALLAPGLLLAARRRIR